MKALLTILLALILAGAGTLYFASQPALQTPLFNNHQGFLSIGHQGGYALWPSNTLYAFDEAVDLGVDMLEMDVHQSKDGHLIVMHDATVDRTTNGSGYIKEQTLAELKTLDAGYHWFEDAPDGSFPFRDKGIQIPTLAEVFARHGEMPMTIEIKQQYPSIAEPLCQLIINSGMSDKVIIGSFHQDALDEFRATCPGIATSMAQTESTIFVLLAKLGLEKLYSPKGQALQVPIYGGGLQVVTPGFIEAAHRQNLKVHVWTINDAGTMKQLMNMGVDGIITDRPDYLQILTNQTNTR